MPALYVDTSALVKRYVGEVGTIWVRRALARPVRQGIYTALLAQPEVLSALQRKVRDRTLAAAEAQRLARRVQRHFARRYRLVAITPTRVTQANALGVTSRVRHDDRTAAVPCASTGGYHGKQFSG
jgi:predicted nucleic acid-binding protein